MFSQLALNIARDPIPEKESLIKSNDAALKQIANFKGSWEEQFH